MQIPEKLRKWLIDESRIKMAEWSKGERHRRGLRMLSAFQQGFLLGGAVMWARSCVAIDLTGLPMDEKSKNILYPKLGRFVNDELEKYFGYKKQLEDLENGRKDVKTNSKNETEPWPDNVEHS